MTNKGSAELVTYYAKRAEILEQVYDKPERQAELAEVTKRLRELLSGQRVLELACGTGYWTERYAQSAESVLATDINLEMLALARAKGLPEGKVTWELADAFDFPQPQQAYSACFAGFWWSHVPRQEQEGFLQHLRRQLGKDTLLVLMDNVYVEGGNTPIARTDAYGNTYQLRSLPSGERFEVIKNFPTDSALRKKLATAVKDIRIVRLDYYWMLTGRLK